jgi:hypothetical protein
VRLVVGDAEGYVVDRADDRVAATGAGVLDDV